jgi:hypothetical protein
VTGRESRSLAVLILLTRFMRVRILCITRPSMPMTDIIASARAYSLPPLYNPNMGFPHTRRAFPSSGWYLTHNLYDKGGYVGHVSWAQEVHGTVN